jgi:flagellar assembly protein FliH
MSSSSRVISRVLRGDDGRRAGAEVVDLHLPVGGPGQGVVADPFVAERAISYRQGYDAAKAEMAAAEESARAARAERLSEALVAAAAAACEQRQAALERATQEAVELAFELTEALIGHEITTNPSTMSLDALKRALALVPRGEDLVVRLHPGDVLTPEEVQDLVKDASVKVVADPDIEVGGCVVEAGPCRIDAQLGPAMARARALIESAGGEAPGSP